MSIKKSAGLQDSGTDANEDDRIVKRMEFDKHGDYTGYEYFRCTGCGIEAMRRRDLCDGECKYNRGWS